MNFLNNSNIFYNNIDISSGNIIFSGSGNVNTIVTGPATFSGTTILTGTVIGNTIFNTGTKNQGIITGDVTFNGESYNSASVTGNITYVTKFLGDAWQTSYEHFQRRLGFNREKLRRIFVKLEQMEICLREFRDVKLRGQTYNNSWCNILSVLSF
jgi:hypothetical protein